MSIREFINTNGSFSMPKITTSQFDVDGATHSNDATGYKIKSSVGTTLLAFDKTDALSECSLKSTITPLQSTQSYQQYVLNSHDNRLSAVETNVGSVSSTLTSHATRLTTLESSGGGLTGGQDIDVVPTLAQVLGQGSDAGEVNITGVQNLTVNSISLGGTEINLTSMLLVNIQNDITTLNSTVSILNTRLTTAEEYITNLKAFFNAFNAGATITDPTTGLDFDFTNLL